MNGDRCPRCGGVLKAGAQWCGLCYADLRPPSPPAAPPPAAPSPAAPAAGALDDSALDDSALAGLALASPAAEPGAEPADPAPPKKRAGWPCTECGNLNPFEVEACVACGLPFGAGLRTPNPSLPGDRRSRLVIGALVALAVMGLIAVLSAVTGSAPPDEVDPPVAPVEISVDG